MDWQVSTADISPDGTKEQTCPKMSQNMLRKTFNSEIVVDCKKLVCFNDGNTRIHVAIAMTMNCIEIRPGTSSNDSHDLFYIFSRCASGGRNRRSEACENSARSVITSRRWTCLPSVNTVTYFGSIFYCNNSGKPGHRAHARKCCVHFFQVCSA